MPSLGDIGQFLAACVLLFNCWQSWRNGQRAKTIKTDVSVIKIQTNGINERLLKVTGEAEHAKGVIEGEAKSN